MNKKKYFLFAWIIWFLSALFMLYKYAIEVSPSVMTQHLMSEFNIDATQLGYFAACYFYAYLIMQLPAGILIDRFGPRKITAIAIAICALGILIFSYTKILFLAEVGRFLTGIGAAFAAINCLKLTANWFPEKQFAFMAGLMMTLGMLGAVGGQAPLAAFIGYLGWRKAILILGISGFILSILFWIVVRDKSKEQHLIDIKLNPVKTNVWENCKTIFRSKQSWFLSIYSGFAFAPVSVFGGLWGVSFIEEYYQLSKMHSAQIVSLIFIGFAVGAPIMGWTSDYLGNRKKIMIFGTVLATFCMVLILYIPMPLFLLNIMMFSFGFFISTFLVCFTMIREINPPIVAATAIGFMNIFDAFFGAFSDPLTGKFLDLGWTGTMMNGARVYSVHTYKWALLTLPLFLIFAIAFLFTIKETYCKSSYPSSLP